MVAAFLPFSALLALIAPARATVPDWYGLGASSVGAGGGGVVLVRDGYAARLNPAGLAGVRKPFAALGFSAAVEDFDEIPPLWWDTNRDGIVDDRDPPLTYGSDVDDATGLHISLARHVGGKWGVGGAVYIPTNRLLRFSTFEPSLPTYFMYVNRPQRYCFALGVGGKILPGVALGASVDFLSAARLKVVATIDATFTGEQADTADEVDDLVGEVVVDVHELYLDLVPRFVPIFGVQLDVGEWAEPLDGLVIAATWRGSSTLKITGDMDIQGDVSVEDVGDLDPFLFAAILKAGLLMYDHYQPPMLTLGAAWRTDGALSAYVDARYTDWRKMLLNVTRLDYLDITSPLVDVDDLVSDGNDFDVELAAVWSVRSGLELRLPRWQVASRFQYARLVFRGGFGWEPTPLRRQGESSSFLDADRTLWSVGAGVETMDPFRLVDGPVRFDGFFQYNRLASTSLVRESATPRAGYPIGTTEIPIGGDIFVAGGQWSFDYWIGVAVIVGRLAPTPSGHLHLGNAAAFAGAWLSARHADGRLLLRIEDVDRGRARPEVARGQRHDLEWLGLGWDAETPTQSSRDYSPALAALADRTYFCACTRRVVQEAGGAYPGTCRDAGLREGAVRFRLPPGPVEVVNRRRGARLVDPAEFGNPVLLQRDGTYTYNHAVVADDIADGVTEVVRGADLLDYTAVQIRLWEAHGAPPPTWLHLPLVLGPDGRKLAKSHGSLEIRALRAAGWSAADVWRLVLPWLGLVGADRPDDAVRSFDPARVLLGPVQLRLPEDGRCPSVAEGVSWSTIETGGFR